MNFQDIYFLFPAAVYFMGLILLIIWLFYGLNSYRLHVLKNNFVSPNLLPKLLSPDRSQSLFWIKCGLTCLAWIFSIIALTQPMSYGHYQGDNLNKESLNQAQLKRRKTQEIIFLIDTSASMTVPDARNGKTRLDAAKEISDSILSLLKGEFAALYTFTSDISQLSPSTLDYLFLRLMINQIGINEGGGSGTDISHALTEIYKKYSNKPEEILKTVIILSDGGDHKNTSNISITPDKHFKIISIGIGSKTPSTIPGITYEGNPVLSGLNEEILKKMASTGNGKYYAANDFSSAVLASDIAKTLEKEHVFGQDASNDISQVKMDPNLIHDLYFQIPLGFALLFLAVALLIPETQRNSTQRRKGAKYGKRTGDTNA